MLGAEGSHLLISDFYLRLSDERSDPPMAVFAVVAEDTVNYFFGLKENFPLR